MRSRGMTLRWRQRRDSDEGDKGGDASDEGRGRAEPIIDQSKGALFGCFGAGFGFVDHLLVLGRDGEVEGGSDAG